MKRFIPGVLILILVINQVSAQTSKGDFLIAGSLGLSLGSSSSDFGGVSSDGPKTTTLSVGLEGGYFVMDNLVIGIGGGFNFFRTSQDVSLDSLSYTQVNTSNSWSAGPFARYYYANSDLWHLWLDLSAAYSSGNSKSKTTGDIPAQFDGPASSGFSTGITPGATIMVGKKMGIEIAYGWLGYSALKSETGGDFPHTEKSSTFNFNFNSLRFGVVYHI